MIFRPLTEDGGHTYRNICQSGEYTFNLLHREILEAGHRSSAKFPAEVSEFAACGLQPVYGQAIRAPYVGESRVRIGLRWVEEHPVAANGTRFVVGSVEELFVPEASLGPDGFVDLSAAGILAGSGPDGYGPAGPFERLAYVGRV
jgi:flavin reductase (DIM6/NTAB) family NADH-FMN oxidoreductase RutF